MSDIQQQVEDLKMFESLEIGKPLYICVIRVHGGYIVRDENYEDSITSTFVPFNFDEVKNERE